MMLSEHDLLDSIFQAALKGCDCDVRAHRHTIWNACLTLMADVLRATDPLGRERLLRGLEAELRDSVAHLNELLKPAAPYPRTPEQVH
jgi:hypothetical protein